MAEIPSCVESIFGNTLGKIYIYCPCGMGSRQIYYRDDADQPIRQRLCLDARERLPDEYILITTVTPWELRLMINRETFNISKDSNC